MSLDVYLTRKREEPSESATAIKLLEENDLQVYAELIRTHYGTEDTETLFEANITHNLNEMAFAAGIYELLWRPEEVGVTKAIQLVEPLKAGLDKLKSAPDYFKTFDARNGWGTYKDFVPWIEKYIEACEAFPDADVNVSR